MIGLTQNKDVGLLLLRLTVGGLMLFHGVHKVIFGHDFISMLLVQHGWPDWMVYGVPLGEVIAPLLLITGYLTRLSSLVIVFTMTCSLYLFFGDRAFSLDEHGAFHSQLNIFFIGSSLCLFFSGPGRYNIATQLKASKAK